MNGPDITGKQAIAQLKADAAYNEDTWDFKKFNLAVSDTKQYYGLWDACDPVVWALLRVVQAQNEVANAFDQASSYVSEDVGERMIEEAFAERIKAIGALQKAIQQFPRDPDE